MKIQIQPLFNRKPTQQKQTNSVQALTTNILTQLPQRQRQLKSTEDKLCIIDNISPSKS